MVSELKPGTYEVRIMRGKVREETVHLVMRSLTEAERYLDRYLDRTSRRRLAASYRAEVWSDSRKVGQVNARP